MASVYSVRRGSAIFLMLTWVFVALSGCKGESVSSREGEPVLVQIPEYNQNGSYTLQVVELKTIRDLNRLDGAAARFYMEPSHFKEKVTGEPPSVRFMKSREGVYIPQDIYSLQLVALYYQFEQLMMMDESLGIKSLNKWPRSIAMNAQYAGNSGSKEVNNALYAPSLDAYLFVPFTNAELPLAVNSGVIGHEHFHSIFSNGVIKKVGDKFPEDLDKDQYHTILLRGLNEGLADVWGWAYSNDFDFVGRSLPSERLKRRLDFDPSSILTAQKLQDLLKLPNPGGAIGLAYSLGAIYARSLYAVRGVLLDKGVETLQVRSKIAESIIASFPKLEARIKNLKAGEVMAPEEPLVWIAEALTGSYQEGCQYLKNLIGKDGREVRLQCR